MSKIVIIGCGVVGAAIAYELSLVPGLDITVIEKNAPATGSTGAALGVLMGIISHKKKGRAWRLRQTSLQRYETLIPELEAITGLSIPVNRQGIFKLLFREDNLDKWQKLQEFRQASGWDLIIGDRNYVQQQCPHLINDNLIGAVYSPQDRQIDPVQLTQALVTAATTNGVKFQFGVTVIDFITQPNPKDELSTCKQLVTATGKIEVEQIIISAGLGSTPLTQSLQQTIPIRPVIGQAIKFKSDRFGQAHFQPVITANDIHIVPLGGAEYWLGATVEFSTETESLADTQLLEQLIQDAIAFCPQLKDATILKTWSGKRPRPEGISAPIINYLPGYSNVLLATAHYRNGVLLAPATALEVVKIIKNSLKAGH